MFDNYEDEQYEKYFNKAYNFFKQGLTNDVEKDIAILNNTIEITATFQGNDWVGRGSISLIKTSASIAAAELLKSELEHTLKKSTNH